jgi:hypothetical protein
VGDCAAVSAFEGDSLSGDGFEFFVIFLKKARAGRKADISIAIVDIPGT